VLGTLWLLLIAVVLVSHRPLDRRAILVSRRAIAQGQILRSDRQAKLWMYVDSGHWAGGCVGGRISALTASIPAGADKRSRQREGAVAPKCSCRFLFSRRVLPDRA
jgi:hypothetical protein